jgi:SAM-dependent methyltransferase
MKMYEDALATMDFRVSWEQDGIRHTEDFHAQRVNFWRDILPTGLDEAMVRRPGERFFSLVYEAGRLLPECRPAWVHHVRQADIEKKRFAGFEIEPRRGRFYPRGILRGVSGVFRENVQPFRCTDVSPEWISADLNHPLCGKKLAVEVSVRDVRPKFEEHGGTSTDWLETALEGPGIQARVHGNPTDFFSGRPFGRLDENQDAVFYGQPRMVNHLDATAIGVVSRLYGRLIRPGAAVLDLMGSWSSHLPAELTPNPLTVLGMNPEELQANSGAQVRVVHDLNLNPRLPLADDSFDAVVCTVSVEYMTRPFEVFEEVSRVLRPGGLFIQTFSNRWFPPKVIHVWQELHDFERMGLVLEYFLKSGQYKKLETYSMRGLPRPEGDKYYGQMLYSDPVYAVWGWKSGA